MKKLLLLLIIPTISYSQTFGDIMYINSLKTFKRVMIENNFEFSSVDSMSMFNMMLYEDYWYGLNVERDEENGNSSELWCIYSKHNDEFQFRFSRNGTTKDGRSVVMDTPYDEIIRKIKSRCRYVDIFNRKDLDYVCYDCPQSSFKGYIGFTVNDGVGYVRHIVPNDYDKIEEE